ncbi:putative FtsX-related transmembrane transport protein [Fulvivirga imtechensis AK7]|uniref:Putative FtsX-related transmembrane transport protein n=1 Tax=Fulvivirga imtechensis AK7 TaxID=1237149 RepID=L8K076_9BACT|nr:ABC transporter permease [Fulvivirga imtechensis]ELR72877.1 putative FtsX-related transmembrane transport protein [Fulvivirga imtechensis AK7]
MLRNYIKISLRNLWKQKVFSLINISGLTLGISVCMVIYLYVNDQLSYDSFHAQSDRIYRLLRIGNLNGEKYLIGVTSGPFAEALHTDFPEEVDQTVRMSFGEGLVAYEDKVFMEEKFSLADSNFLDVFTFPLAQGNPKTALDQPNSVIITGEIARKYFGDDSPLNKMIRVDNEFDLMVTGVFEELPAKSHMDFDFVGNLALLRNASYFSDWWSNSFITYVLLNDPASESHLEAQFPGFMDKYFGKDFETMTNRIDITLQPLSETYFEQDVRYDEVLHGSKSSVIVFSVVGIFIFLIACINFMNLATAKSVLRAREVGVRKTLGSSKKGLMIQFLGEAFLISGVSVVLAFMSIEVVLPVFNHTFGLELSLTHELPVLLPMLGFIIVVTGLLSGIYPAFILSAYKPVEVLKGKVKSGKSGVGFRKVLVILQFTTSAFLIIMTLMVGRQMNFIQEKDLGFDKQQVLTFPLNHTEIRNNREAFKNKMLEHPAILSVGAGTGIPGGFHDTMTADIEGLDENPRFRTLFADADYFRSFGLQIVAGRGFRKDHAADHNQVVVLNERAVRETGLTNDEIIGRRLSISFDSIPKTVVGVVKDYNFSSLKAGIEPLMITNRTNGRMMAIKIQGDVKDAVEYIENAWSAHSAGYPIAYEFLDENFNRLYQTEQLQGRLFTIFSGIVIFISCLGIFGLATFTANQRLKEIGIRKALGASIKSITSLLVKDYLVLVLIANLVAWPLGWYFSRQWLDQFAYKVSIGVEVFALTLLVAMAIALASVVMQSVKAAMANPVDVLKEE